MVVIVLAMALVLALVLGVLAVVVMGQVGWGRYRTPELADGMAKAARHLNGDGRPPRALVRMLS